MEIVHLEDAGLELRGQHVEADARQLEHHVLEPHLALQHARTEEAPAAAGARALQRVQISDASFPALIARAREQQRQREGRA